VNERLIQMLAPRVSKTSAIFEVLAKGIIHKELVLISHGHMEGLKVTAQDLTGSAVTFGCSAGDLPLLTSYKEAPMKLAPGFVCHIMLVDESAMSTLAVLTNGGLVGDRDYGLLDCAEKAARTMAFRSYCRFKWDSLSRWWQRRCRSGSPTRPGVRTVLCFLEQCYEKEGRGVAQPALRSSLLRPTDAQRPIRGIIAFLRRDYCQHAGGNHTHRTLLKRSRRKLASWPAVLVPDSLLSLTVRRYYPIARGWFTEINHKVSNGSWAIRRSQKAIPVLMDHEKWLYDREFRKWTQSLYLSRFAMFQSTLLSIRHSVTG
jgi:hypothetical protein